MGPITVSVKEGVFLFNGTRDDGSLEGGSAPKRFRRFMSKPKQHQTKEH